MEREREREREGERERERERESEVSEWTLVTAGADGSVNAWTVTPTNITLSHSLFTLPSLSASLSPSLSSSLFADVVISANREVAVSVIPTEGGRGGGAILSCPLSPSLSPPPLSPSLSPSLSVLETVPSTLANASFTLPLFLLPQGTERERERQRERERERERERQRVSLIVWCLE
jgi:hypothetical protein